jgi:hypothetical protein
VESFGVLGEPFHVGRGKWAVASVSSLLLGFDLRHTAADNHWERVTENAVRHVKNVQRCMFNGKPYPLPYICGPLAFEAAVKKRNHGRSRLLRAGDTRFSIIHKRPNTGAFLSLPFATVIWYKAPDSLLKSEVEERQRLGQVVGTDYHSRNLTILQVKGTARCVDRVDYRIADVTGQVLVELRSFANKHREVVATDFARFTAALLEVDGNLIDVGGVAEGAQAPAQTVYPITPVGLLHRVRKRQHKPTCVSSP